MSEVRSRVSEVRYDTVQEELTVVAIDSIKEVTTVTIRQNEAGDTLQMVTITDRSRTHASDRAHNAQEKATVQSDTVYVEKRDSSFVSTTNRPNPTNAKPGNIVSALRWLFRIVLAIVCIMGIIKLVKVKG